MAANPEAGVRCTENPLKGASGKGGGRGGKNAKSASSPAPLSSNLQDSAGSAKGSGKGGGKRAGSKGSGKRAGGKRPSSDQLPFNPMDLPSLTEESRELVAFQARRGAPWTVMGKPPPGGTTFEWSSQQQAPVSRNVKEAVKALLGNYASANGVPLSGKDPVKLALQRLEEGMLYWISYSGGVSSATPVYK
eukprot:gnl/TRDRNA2_/TRDRNA2_148212_c0_seq1.p1 gnl/TRDRNA2_/TRDRNA2_148212_c0~~gnl/TRDRNA2_/TRDRNA2_148212_c0_seq1.p1  ORF type:complete len:216 (+),score=36.31 gnl/TRDRNA2_/TRDRNA2_148212_c0_seq1:76-648(+)